MTNDNEIIKALECCGGTTCEGCPFQERFGKKAPCPYLEKYALDLINRQKAEISELQRKNSELEIEVKAMRCFFCGKRQSHSNPFYNLDKEGHKICQSCMREGYTKIALEIIEYNKQVDMRKEDEGK